MRWFKPSLRNSLYGLLGHGHASDSRLDEGMEVIREQMLELLGPDAPARYPNVTRKIRYANDLQSLWYLRGDLMATLASQGGEAAAREQLLPVTRLFRGLLPPSQTSRPSPLLG